MMTYEKMKQIIETEIPINVLEKNKGIYVFYVDGELSIGISYEDLDEYEDIYIFNLFLDTEYININETYRTINEKFVCVDGLDVDIINELVKEWNNCL